MIKVLFVNDWPLTFLARFGPSFALLPMLVVLISWDCHLAIGAFDGLEFAGFQVGWKVLGGDLILAMLALLEVMKFFLMLLCIIDVVGAVAVSASLNVAATVAQVQVEFIIRQRFLAVVAELHLFVYFWNLYKHLPFRKYITPPYC